jgi:hypothetical protein
MFALSAFTPETARSARAVLTDIDDTLTEHGRLPAVAYAALEALQAEGIVVLPVTGRPAGWCDLIARQWPVHGVIGENGAFWFRYDGKARRMSRVYRRSATERTDDRARLSRVASDILTSVPGSAIAADQDYRSADLAIDFCEDVPPLDHAAAERIRDIFAAHGAIAKISSIHVNGWYGQYDKLTTSLAMLREVFGIDGDRDRERVVFVGDSPNDAPMFGHFPNAVGVANVLDFAGRIEHLPRYVTQARGGQGFAEFARRLIALRVG